MRNDIRIGSSLVYIFDDENDKKRQMVEQALIDLGIDAWLEYCERRIHRDYVLDIYEFVNHDGPVELTEDEVEKIRKYLLR